MSSGETPGSTPDGTPDPTSPVQVGSRRGGGTEVTLMFPLWVPSRASDVFPSPLPKMTPLCHWVGRVWQSEGGERWEVTTLGSRVSVDPLTPLSSLSSSRRRRTEDPGSPSGRSKDPQVKGFHLATAVSDRDTTPSTWGYSPNVKDLGTSNNLSVPREEGGRTGEREGEGLGS